MNDFKLNHRGISLVEILISMGILGIILLPVFMTFSSGNRNMMVTETEFRAHTMGLELMEQLISLPFKHIPIGKYSSEQIKEQNNTKELAIPFNFYDNPDFKPEIEITRIKKNDRIRFKKIALQTGANVKLN
jgi:type II secretory pathway pseudopilin PulG